MPGLTHSIEVHKQAADIPRDVLDALRRSERDANVILPTILHSLGAERPGQVWVVCRSGPHIQFILSCTEGYMGAYPIFIMTTLPYVELTPAFIHTQMVLMAKALKPAVPVHRVYSVFSATPISRVFAGIWSELTGVALVHQPYYAAKLSYCTIHSLVDGSDLGCELRPAESRDTMKIAELCYEFAYDSPPFRLTREQSVQEAEYLVGNGLVWVHCAQSSDAEDYDVASIVAFTRNSENVVTISKVFTHKGWRQRGCAERLVRRVCKHFLQSKKKSVVLYVAHDNHPAAKVYHKVGFVGLGQDDQHVEGVDSWEEIGFDTNVVRLGHW